MFSDTSQSQLRQVPKELKRSNVQILDPLGEGNFGFVHKAQVRGRIVSRH